MNKGHEPDNMEENKVLSDDTIAEEKGLQNETTPPQNPLNTFFALAGGARFQWGTELHDAQGKNIEQLIAEDLGEEEEVLNTLQQYKEGMLEINEDPNDHTDVPTG